MKVPVPTNKLVAFTLLGAILTGVIAIGLGAPNLGLPTATDGTHSDTSGSNTGVVDAPVQGQNPARSVSVPSELTDDDHEKHPAYEEHSKYEDERFEED